MSNTEFRTKMAAALEAMQKSCSDMLEAVTGEGRNMELPQGTDPSPARRMWKRWVSKAAIEDMGSPAPILMRQDSSPYRLPVTILPGHDAVEQIEREAYQRGQRDGELTERGRWVYDHTPQSIDGVLPVVVDGWTHDDYDDSRTMPPYPWTEELGSRRLVASVWRRKAGACNTPCRVYMYPGVGSDGKKVQP